MSTPTPTTVTLGGKIPSIRSWARRGALLIAWFAPSAALALMPKCPLCVAAYLAMATGLSLSFAAASALQTGIIAGCVLMLGILSAWQVRRWVLARATNTRVPSCCGRRSRSSRKLRPGDQAP